MFVTFISNMQFNYFKISIYPIVTGRWPLKIAYAESYYPIVLLLNASLLLFFVVLRINKILFFLFICLSFYLYYIKLTVANTNKTHLPIVIIRVGYPQTHNTAPCSKGELKIGKSKVYNKYLNIWNVPRLSSPRGRRSIGITRACQL